MTRPFRIIAAVAVYDGHDASILALNKALMAGPEPLELIYLGYNMGAEKIALAATRESADAIAVASYNGGHLEFYPRLLNLLKKLTPVPLVFAGGGATIFPQEKRNLEAAGVAQVYLPGTTLPEIATDMRQRVGQNIHIISDTDHEIGGMAGASRSGSVEALAQMLTTLEHRRKSQTD